MIQREISLLQIHSHIRLVHQTKQDETRKPRPPRPIRTPTRSLANRARFHLPLDILDNLYRNCLLTSSTFQIRGEIRLRIAILASGTNKIKRSVYIDLRLPPLDTPDL